MAVSSVEVQREILAEPAAVWRLITDLDRAPDVLSEVVRVERLEGEGYDVGVSWRETRRVLGKETSEDKRVTSVRAPFSTSVSAESRGTRYLTVVHCEPSDLGTVLRMEFSGESVNPTLGQKIAWALFRKVELKAARDGLKQDVADYARTVESE